MSLQRLPVFSMRNFEDYNHCHHCDNNFYIREFDKHIRGNLFIDKPHGHDFFIVLLITKGSGVHYIDFKTYNISPGDVFFLSPGQVHSWELSKDINGYIVFFTREYFLVDFNTKDLSKLPFFNTYINPPQMKIKEEDMEEVLSTFQRIGLEYLNRGKFFHEAIRLNLRILLILFERRYDGKRSMPQLMKYQENQIRKFEALVDEHYKSHLPLSEYASMMNISLKQLTTLCKKAVDKTPGDVIKERLMLEAKRLLIHSEHSVSRISQMLNYTDNSYFIRLFRKASGNTPEQFRKLSEVT